MKMIAFWGEIWLQGQQPIAEDDGRDAFFF